MIYSQIKRQVLQMEKRGGHKRRRLREEEGNMDAFIDFLIDEVLFPEIKEDKDDVGPREEGTNRQTG